MCGFIDIVFNNFFFIILSKKLKRNVKNRKFKLYMNIKLRDFKSIMIFLYEKIG